MSRSKPAKTRRIKPDPIYGSFLVAKLINKAMRAGKKSAAQTQVYKALELLKQKTPAETLKLFEQALKNIRPNMEVRSRRVGGAAYQVPYPVRGVRRDALALRWLIEAARSRPNKEFHTFAEKLAIEITEAAQAEGLAVKKRVDTHRMADSNKAFAHFRW